MTSRTSAASSKQVVAAWAKVIEMSSGAQQAHEREINALKSMFASNRTKMAELGDITQQCESFKLFADNIIRTAISKYRFKVIERQLANEAQPQN